MDTMQATRAQLRLGDKGLSVPLPSGRDAYFNYFWLRDNCPTSFSPVTRERSYDIFHLNQAPRPESAVVEGDQLVIHWTREDHTTRMPLATLARYASGDRRPDPADLPRKAWYGDHYPDVARFAQPDLLADKAKVKAWLEALIVEGGLDHYRHARHERGPDRPREAYGPGAADLLRRLFRR